MFSQKNIKGFTLVELSIVIVIISLIVAGVTAGSSLVSSAKLRRTVQVVDQIQAGILSFKYQYGALPGDLKNASSYWPSVGLDGDGNGNWNCPYWDNGGCDNLRVWQHLALAKYIPGSYTATGNPGGGVTPGVNMPLLPYGGQNTIAAVYDDIWGRFTTRNYLMIGDRWFWETSTTNASSYPVAWAYDLDKKIDDGKPYTGRVLALAWVDNLCFATGFSNDTNGQSVSGRASANYDLTVNKGHCNIYFNVLNELWK